MSGAIWRGSASAAASLLSARNVPKFFRTAHLSLRISTNKNHLLRPLSTSFPTCRPAGAASAAASFRDEGAFRDESIEPDVEEQAGVQQPSSNQSNQAVNYGPVTRFHELEERGMVCPTVVRTITEDLGHKTMTEVQSLTINETLKGIDVLAQAKTGTGKTLAFLIPVLQNIINNDMRLEHRRARATASSMDIRAIIVSPTRELAEQIGMEAKKICMNTGVKVQTAVGGTQKREGLARIRRDGCHVLVGTPGRLNDILSDPRGGVEAPNLSAFVLDEADRLLDDGFFPEIQSIQDSLPSRKSVDRQTLLFSATVPREIMQVVRSTMKPNFKVVRTVQEDDQQTHEKVLQKLVMCGGLENLLPSVVELCSREIAHSQTPGAKPFKALVFYNTAADVNLDKAIVSNMRESGGSQYRNSSPLGSVPIIEIHSRLSQAQRTRASEKFRYAESAIMFTTDVSARGMDFPNVTHIIQVGLPSNEEQYIHRLGRTARGDKDGEGWLFISGLETRVMRTRLPKMPLVKDTSLQSATVDMRREAQIPDEVAKILTQVTESASEVSYDMKNAAYASTLGIFGWLNNKQQLVDAMNDRAKFLWGMEKPPGLNPKLVSRLGFKGIEGLEISRAPPPDRFDGDSSYESRGQGFSPRFGSRSGGGPPSQGGGRYGFSRGERDGNSRYRRDDFSRGDRDGNSRYRRDDFSRDGGRGGFTRPNRDDYSRGNRDSRSQYNKDDLEW